MAKSEDSSVSVEYVDGDVYAKLNVGNIGYRRGSESAEFSEFEYSLRQAHDNRIPCSKDRQDNRDMASMIPKKGKIKLVSTIRLTLNREDYHQRLWEMPTHGLDGHGTPRDDKDLDEHYAFDVEREHDYRSGFDRIHIKI